MDKPLVSIIIPVYNVEKYLPQCLDSVLGQTYSNIEVICVNDGSPDNSGAILAEYADKDARIKVIEIKNQGLSGARNVGTLNCRGDYLMYLDSDDWIDSDTIETSLLNIIDYGADIVLWNYIKEYSNSSQPVDIFHETIVYDNVSFRDLHKQLIGLTGKQLKFPGRCDSISTAWGKLYRNDIIKINKIQFVDTKVIGTEDLLFNAEYFNYCHSAVALPHRFNHYRKQNSESLARRYKPQLFQQWTELHQRLSQVCAERYYLSQSVSNRTALSLIGLGINEVLAPYSMIQKYRNINSIIKNPRYKDALAKIEISKMPIYWKLFFGSARLQLSFFVLILLYVITGITERY
jgi:glycosyltransferase EpsH